MATTNQSDSETRQLLETKIPKDYYYHNSKHIKPFQKWKRAIKVRQSCHSKLARRYHSIDRTMSCISVTLNAITSSVIFTSIAPIFKENDSTAASGDNTDMLSAESGRFSELPFILSIVAGVISALTTILQAVLRSLNYAQESEQHLLADRQFTKIRFRFELLVGDKCEDDGHISPDALKIWLDEYAELLDSAPIIPQAMFDKETLEIELAEQKKSTMRSRGANDNNADLDEVLSYDVEEVPDPVETTSLL